MITAPAANTNATPKNRTRRICPSLSKQNWTFARSHDSIAWGDEQLRFVLAGGRATMRRQMPPRGSEGVSQGGRERIFRWHPLPDPIARRGADAPYGRELQRLAFSRHGRICNGAD